MRIEVDGQHFDVPDDSTSDEIDHITKPQEQPSLLRKALGWATTPFEGYKPIVEQRQKIAATQPPGLINKDSPDWLAGAGQFVSGAMPGADPDALPPETKARMDRFAQENPKTAFGLGMGGALGNPANAVLPGESVAQAPGLMDKLANSLAARTLKGTAGEYKNLGKEGIQDVGRFLLDRKAVRFGSSPAAVAERVAGLPEATGRELGGAIEALDQTGGQVSKQALAQRFSQLAEEAKSGGPGAGPLVAKYEKAATDVLKDIETSGQPMMSFKQAEQWKQAYQAPINYSKSSNTPLEMGSRELASAARQGVEDAAGAVGEGTQLGENFLQAKQQSGLAQQSAKMAVGAEGRRTARNMLSPSGTATSLTAALAAIAAGHPAAAMPALLLGPGAQLLRARGPAAAAVTARTLSGVPLGRAALQAAPSESMTLRDILDALRRKQSLQPQLAQNE